MSHAATPETVTHRLDPAAGPVELTRQLCNIESVSGDERGIADAVEAVLRRVDEGERLKAAVAGVAEASGLGKSELYDAAVAARKGRS